MIETVLVSIISAEFLTIVGLFIYLTRLIAKQDSERLVYVKAIMAKNLTELATSTNIENQTPIKTELPEFVTMDEALNDDTILKKMLSYNKRGGSEEVI